MRLTAELILKSPDYINPCKDRELNLRGNKISSIENLGATKNQFDTIDFSDNEISKVENFPKLERVKTLLFNNNHIKSFEEDFGSSLPHLRALILSNNRINNLSDLEPLTKLSEIKFISLLENPVSKKPNYRLYLIHLVPHLKIIDFRKVKKIEREESKKLFGQSKLILEKYSTDKNKDKSKTFEPGESVNNNSSSNNNNKISSTPVKKLTEEEKKSIRLQIDNAKTMEEINILEAKLRTGDI
ncbi:hypothetical protein ACTFIR_010361 [Dictyostelium discoideum]